MDKQLEIEYKNLLEEKEYSELLKHFDVQESDFIEQTNYYFDTDDFQLKSQGIGLRIRTFAESGEFTLKVPSGDHLMEYNVPLKSPLEKTEIVHKQFTWPQEIIDVMITHEIETGKLDYLFSLKTKRFERNLKEATLVLDKSTYGSKVDFELEVEGRTEESALELFHFLLSHFNIERKPSQNKVHRAFEEWKKQES